MVCGFSSSGFAHLEVNVRLAFWSKKKKKEWKYPLVVFPTHYAGELVEPQVSPRASSSIPLSSGRKGTCHWDHRGMPHTLRGPPSFSLLPLLLMALWPPGCLWKVVLSLAGQLLAESSMLFYRVAVRRWTTLKLLRCKVEKTFCLWTTFC